MFGKAFVAFVALAASVNASCLHATSHMRRQANENVQVSIFGYTGLNGPTNWAALDPSFAGCATNTIQSPINIDATIGKAAEVPQVVINPVQAAEFENLGSTVEVIVQGNTTFAGTTFALQQFHFHTPSEHRVNEEYFPLEVHMVHEGPAGEIAVIALLFQLSEDGTTTDLLTNVVQNIAQIQTPGTRTTTGPLDFTQVINHISTTPLFQYTGSLTTPPCAEGLTFLITEQPLPIDVKTFNLLKSTVKFNARFTQNTLGQTNLLQVAADFAIQRDGLNVAGGGAEAVNGTQFDRNGNQINIVDNSVVGSADIQAIVAAVVTQNQELTFQTLTTTTTTVKVGGAQVGRGRNGQEIVQLHGQPQVGNGHQNIQENKQDHKQENKNKENEHLVKIQRSRVARAPAFRSRTDFGKRRL